MKRQKKYVQSYAYDFMAILIEKLQELKDLLMWIDTTINIQYAQSLLKEYWYRRSRFKIFKNVFLLPNTPLAYYTIILSKFVNLFEYGRTAVHPPYPIEYSRQTAGCWIFKFNFTDKLSYSYQITKHPYSYVYM